MIQAVVSLSCNDSLPAYITPTDFLHATVRMASPPEVNYSYVEFSNDISVNPVTVSSLPQTIYVDVVSSFDETLQDEPDVSGTLEIVDPEIPNLKATIPLTLANFTGVQYNPSTKLLTLDPGDTLRIRCIWRYKSDDGRWAFEKAAIAYDSEVNASDPPLRGSFERTHVPMNFSVSARLRLFSATNSVTTEKEPMQLLFHGHIIFPP